MRSPAQRRQAPYRPSATACTSHDHTVGSLDHCDMQRDQTDLGVQLLAAIVRLEFDVADSKNVPFNRRLGGARVARAPLRFAVSSYQRLAGRSDQPVFAPVASMLIVACIRGVGQPQPNELTIGTPHRPGMVNDATVTVDAEFTHRENWRVRRVLMRACGGRNGWDSDGSVCRWLLRLATDHRRQPHDATNDRWQEQGTARRAASTSGAEVLAGRSPGVWPGGAWNFCVRKSGNRVADHG